MVEKARRIATMERRMGANGFRRAARAVIIGGAAVLGAAGAWRNGREGSVVWVIRRG